MTLEMYVPDWSRLRDPGAMNAMAADTAALDREGALVLVCTYEGAGRRSYWYETVPRIIREGRLNAALSPHPFAQIAGAATTCPAQVERAQEHRAD
jgi:hypothetical protein